MLRIRKSLLPGVLLLLTGGCAIGPVNGLLYTSTSFAGEFNSANDVPAIRMARGCQHQILGILAWGDAGAGSIAFFNNIERIATVDHSTTSVLISLYRNYCTIVTGEPGKETAQPETETGAPQ